MSDIIDRRENPRHKSAVNAQRFLKRYRAQVRDAVGRAIAGRKIAEADRDASITIPSRDLSEPTFQHGAGGKREVVLPGNQEYVTGDEIQRPQGGGADRVAALPTTAKARTRSASASRARSSSTSSSRTWRCPIS